MTARRAKRPVLETYAAHYILMNIGFDPAEIFVSTPNVLNGAPPGLYASVIVRRGGLEFVMNLVQLPDAAACDRFLAAFHRFAEAQPSMDRRELDRMVRRTDVWRRRTSLVSALLLKGFELREGPSN